MLQVNLIGSKLVGKLNLLYVFSIVYLRKYKKLNILKKRRNKKIIQK